MEAIRQAAEAGKYLFAFFWKDDDENTAAMRRVFDSATTEFADRADSVAVKITEPAQKEVVEEFGLDRAPMPLRVEQSCILATTRLHQVYGAAPPGVGLLL